MIYMPKVLRSFSKVVLIALQWLLVLWGLFLILIALNTYTYEIGYFSSLPAAAPTQDSYTPPTFQRLLTGVATGLVAIGIGAVLFYLRRIFLRQND